MEKLLLESPEGRARLQTAKARLDSEVATRMERMLEAEESDAKRPKPNPEAGSSSSTDQQKRRPDSQVDASAKKQKGEFTHQKRDEQELDESDQLTKRPRGDGSGVDVGSMERLMQEDFSWCVGSLSTMCENDPADVIHVVTDMSYFDERTGEQFDQRLVRAAEAEELARFNKMDVYGYADRDAAMSDSEGVFVKVRWVRVSKGTKSNPVMKCRLVAQELAYEERMDDLDANTPSLSCICLAMAYAAQEGRGRKLMTLDFKSAFLYGTARRKIYIELPSADPLSGGNVVGVLKKALYGTRDAPQIWQHHLRGTLLQAGFRQSMLQPSVYVHDDREIMMVIHVDDFLVAGTHESLAWVHHQLNRVYELKKQVISSDPVDGHATSYLNRQLVWDVHNSLSYEGDVKHVDMLLRGWGGWCRAKV